MSHKLYHLEVLVGEGDKKVWKPMRPTGGQPYRLTLAEAESKMGVFVNQCGYPDRYRIVEAR